ncbi:hypothetical protein FA95DRAFT_1561247 [Auriscalpium vulgare]|uniref:Uncharacterized protein n=1 Tax=Auriscalpium vulgare TaxID=40419 RepID=A0ACB8RN03_9AGAM|nr:hypothetical protein FA95DRAFT_1561247 [Auriscalpium vulgare]
MDRFLAPHSPEAQAHYHVTENSTEWDMEQASLNEAIIAHCASYQALSRYLSGADLLYPPKSKGDLLSILRRYSHVAVHNIIARARTTLEPGGYSRTLHLCEASIDRVVNTGDNLSVLLSWHNSSEFIVSELEHPARSIRI